MAKARTPDLQQQIDDLGTLIYTELDRAWGNLLTDEDRVLLAAIAKRGAEITFLEIAGYPQKRARLNLKAQISNLSVAGRIRAEAEFWRTVWVIVSKSLQFALAVV
jgi:spore maturation protein CgeB